MKTLVTGASGFVGSAVTRQLLDAGHDVRVLIRPQSNRRNIDGLAAEVVTGDLTDRSSLERAVVGCETLFHVAADYRMWVPDPDRTYKTNVAGTRDLMQVAAHAGVKKIVYTSSVATLGLAGDGGAANEDTPVTLADMVGHYKRSKFLAEQEVQWLNENEGLPVVIVNPSTPIGPRDIRPTPTGRMIVDAVNGRMPAYVDTGLNLVHVDDVAMGHLLALERGKLGQRYILGSRNMTLKEILTVIADMVGRRPPKFRLPHNVILPVAYVSQAWTRLTRGAEPRITVDGVRLSKKTMFFSNDKARRELDFNPRPIEEALQAAITWFRDNGYCR